MVISPFTHVASPGAAGARMNRADLSPLNVGLLSRANRFFVRAEFERSVLSGGGLDRS